MMERETKMAQARSPMMQQCIEECLDCHSICLETVAHCLQMGGKHAQPQHIVMLLDCAEICQTSANYMLRESPLHGRTCGLCAQVCELCAQDCETFPDDEQMMACAEECRRCAASCEEMAQMMS
ncbi:MAG TPA: four-helix bundle copper-binding protein [Anaerolineae bacterium]|nr:four-helix bundle copper-binding protein [Anaerolineae bacterium]